MRRRKTTEEEVVGQKENKGVRIPKRNNKMEE
jgi:hypothetical protein